VFRNALRVVFDVERPPSLAIARSADTSPDPVTAQLTAIGNRDRAFSQERFLDQVRSLFSTLQQARAQGDAAPCHGLIAEGLAGQLVGSSQGGPGWMRVTTSFTFERSTIVQAACRSGLDEVTVRVWSRSAGRSSRRGRSPEARPNLLVEDWRFRRSVPTLRPASGGVAAVAEVLIPGPWILEAVGHVSSALGRSGFQPPSPL